MEELRPFDSKSLERVAKHFPHVGDKGNSNDDSLFSYNNYKI